MHEVLTLKGWRFSGVGRVVPRLQVMAELGLPNKRLQVTADPLTLTIAVSNEILASAAMPEPIGLLRDGQQVFWELPLPASAIEYIDALSPGPDIRLDIKLSGRLWVTEVEPDPEPRFRSAFESGQAVAVDLNRNGSHAETVPISRLDWLEKVLTPIGWGSYIWTEVRLPPLPKGDKWKRAWDHVLEAERQLRLCNDPGVFLACRAAVEGLAPEPKQLLASLPEGAKRSALDELFKQLTHYVHEGRHVAKDGPAVGTFDVNRADALLALGMTKLTISYLAAIQAG